MSVNRDGDSHYRRKQMETDGKTTKIKTDIDRSERTPDQVDQIKNGESEIPVYTYL